MKTILLAGLLAISCLNGFSQVQVLGEKDSATKLSTTTLQREDTVRALRRLFERKRKGGTARGIVFGIIGTASLVGTLSYKPTYVTPPGSSQRIETSSGPTPANYVFIAFSTVLSISGFSQASQYNPSSLQKVLNDYQNGKRLSARLKSKLKKKDFY